MVFERLKNIFRPDSSSRDTHLGISAEDVWQATQRAEEREFPNGHRTYLAGVMLGSARRKEKLTVDDLAQKLGVSREFVIDAELGYKYLYELAQYTEGLENILHLKKGTIGQILLYETKRK